MYEKLRKLMINPKKKQPLYEDTTQVQPCLNANSIKFMSMQ